MTLAQARAYVLSRLGVSSGETALVAVVDSQLNVEYQRIVLELMLMVDKTDLALTAGDDLVDLPNDFGEILKLRRNGVVLQQITWDHLAALGEAPAESESLGYTFNGPTRIRLGWTPSENDNDGLQLWYTTTADSWTGVDGVGTSASPNALPVAYHDLPCERVVAFLALTEEDLGLAAAATSRANEIEAKLTRHLGRRVGRAGDTITIRGKA